MRNRRRQAPDCGHAILSSRSLFQSAHISKILERDHQAARLARFGKQRRDGKPQTQRPAVRSQTIRLKSGTDISRSRGVHRGGNLPCHVAEKNRGVLPAHIGQFVTRNLFSRRIEGVNASLQIRGDDS